MKRALFALPLIAGLAVWAGPPTAVGVWLDPAVDYRFINCALVGSTRQVVPNGKYLMRVLESDVTVTFGAPFDGGVLNNRPFSQATSLLLSLSAADGGTSIGCQSADGGGDLYLTGTHY